MAARSPDEAARHFVRDQNSLFACITLQRFTTILIPGGRTRDFAIAIPEPASLRTRSADQSGYRFDARIRFVATALEFQTSADWRAEIRAYEYRLLDRDHRELLVYHWQPGPAFAGPDFPHLHVSAALDAQFDALTRRRIELDKRHLVTGLVTLQAVVRMLITEFGVRPLRPDWEAQLEEAATH